MIPILFSETAIAYTTNGIGRLSDAISCVVTEERNGQYELALEYPVTGRHYSDIAIRRIIAAKPCEGGSLQAFRIYEISRPISGRVEIFAHHVSYDLSKNVAMPFSVGLAPTACASALAGLKSHAVEACPFTFWTDVTTASSYSQPAPASIRSRLGGVEGSVLDQFGGEYEWDNFTVKLHRQRGRVNTGIALRYGKNITDLTQEENIANTVTGLVPYWTDSEGNLVTLTEKAVYSQYASRYSAHLTEAIDMSGDFESQPTQAALRAAAQALVNKSDFGLPKVSIEVSFVALWQTEEYKDIAPLQSVNLCDEITVHFDKLGVDATAKVVGTEYDVLKEKYLSIQIGSARSSLSQVIDDNNAKTIQAIQAQKVETSTAINNATKWLTTAGGYVIAIKNTDGTWKELVFSNKTDPYANDAKILRINNNGIGFSVTGMNGTFRNAWTIDGNLVADFIHGGTLTLGGSNNGNGVMSFVDGNGREIIRIDRTGAYFYSWAQNQSTGAWEKSTIGSWTVNGIDIDKGDINLGGNFHVTNAGKVTASDMSITGGSVKIGNKQTITDANDGVYIASEGIALGKSNTFKVTNAGAVTAKSGTIGGFSLTDSAIHTGNTPAQSGNIVLSTADVSKTINNVARAVRLALGTKFGVASDGKIYATDANIKGSIEITGGSISIKNGDTVYFNVTSQGKLTARDGYIGNGTSGWVIGDNNIHNNGGPTSISSTGTAGTYVGTNGFLNDNGSSYTQITGGKITTNDLVATAGEFTGDIKGGSITINNGRFYVDGQGRVHILTDGVEEGYLIIEDPSGKKVYLGGEKLWTEGAGRSITWLELINHIA